MATQIIYNGTVIGTVTAGQSKILKCNGKKMKSDVEIRAGERTEIKYDGAVIATVEAGSSKTIKCAGKTMKSNIEIRVEDDTPGKEGVSPTVEMIDIEGGTRIIITDVNGPKSADIMDGKDGVDGKDGTNGSNGTDGKDGTNGKDGVDGVSPTVSVSKSGKVTTVSITDKNGTKTATINDGVDGKDGAAGSNGVGIKSVVQTTTSSADGGSNVITVTKTDDTTSTFTVKNGREGSDGKDGYTPIKGVDYFDGKDGTSVTVKSVSESTADGGSNVVTFSDGKTLTVKNGSKGSAGKDGTNGKDGYTPQKGVDYFDGLNGSDGRDGVDGKTPVKGVDYFTEADKAEIVAAVIESLGGNPIFGIVDENNNIIVNGDLPDGTYTVKYEMEGGKIINIGNLVLDSNVYYTVTKNLTNCTISNSATQAVQGGSYSATITAKSGYELKSVSVTMGGSAVSVSGGVINIASVTGNIVITAVAEEVKAAYTNLADPTSADWAADSRISSSGTPTTGATGFAVTNFIGPVYNGDIIRVRGMKMDGTTQYYRCAAYKSDKTLSGAGVAVLTSFDGVCASNITVTTTGAQFTNTKDGFYWRLGGQLNSTASDVVITINEEIT